MSCDLIVVELNNEEMAIVLSGVTLRAAEAALTLIEQDIEIYNRRYCIPAVEVAKHIKKESHKFFITMNTLRYWLSGVAIFGVSISENKVAMNLFDKLSEKLWEAL